jgi:hypothetical protein
MATEGRWLAGFLWDHQRYIRYFNVTRDKFEIAVLRSRASKLCRSPLWLLFGLLWAFGGCTDAHAR